MEESKIMSPQIKGIIISMIIIILGIAGYYSNLAFSSWYNWAVNGVMVIALIVACIHFANQKEGYVTFGKVFLHGFITTVVIALIIVIYSVLAFTVLFPDMKEKIFEMQVEQMEKRGMDSDKIDQAMNMMKRFFWVGLIAGAIFGNLIFGCIASLIGAAVAKKNKINPLEQLPS
jgi:predicted MFS family arabinose efflux permease